MNPRTMSLGLFLVLAACTSEQEPSSAKQPQSVAPTVNEEGAGYQHALAKSRFDAGAGVRREAEGGYERVVGGRGVFFVDTVTRATMVVPTFGAPGLPKGALGVEYPRPLTENPDEHSAVVKAYFLEAGVPVAQVSGTHVTTTMAGGGPVRGGVSPAQSKLLWYTTHLERSVGGIPVEGSFAYAALDNALRVISEGVYWPDIPSDVVRGARELQRRLDSPNDRAEFLARVWASEASARETAGEVKIVHTSAGHHGGYEVRAVYSVVVRGPNGGKFRILRFDETGAPVTMSDERATTTDSLK